MCRSARLLIQQAEYEDNISIDKYVFDCFSNFEPQKINKNSKQENDYSELCG